MMERKDLMVVLSLVVIASGCAHTAGGTSGSASSDSVSVTNFTAFPQEVMSNQQVRLRLSLKNDGDTDAESVTARLFNVPFESESGSNNNVWKLDGSRSISFNTLQAADEEADLPARENSQYWTLTAPDLDSGVTIPYQFMSRIYYEYSTQGTSSITLMDQQRFREQGGASRPSLDNDDGPIQMEIRTTSPIVFYPSEESRTSEMCIIVTNEGTGTPFLHEPAYSDGSYDVSDSISNQVKLRVPDQGGIQFSPADNPDANTAVVELFGNRGIKCFTITADNWEQGLGPQEEVPIVLEAIYGYYRETSTSVTVQGSDRFSGGDSEADTDQQQQDGGDSSDGEGIISGPPE